ncbi:hypothetical protein [Borrelia sp. RT5S]|uniref:hypothetical protein n=1 Tax=Borrelia sp. RT5S TaxID=2898581 RepID=UPI001E5E4F8B|nr:hypothetical protein [Borrelia sp. RT5S]UGQ16721.1 hypothetical protein LSO06_05220 [Borrelia sp. RT5S]
MDTKINFNIKKTILETVKGFIGIKVEKNLDVLLPQIPARLKEVASISAQETPLGFNIEVKIASPLAGKLDTGEAYKTPPSLAAIRAWASYKGLASAAVPIWLAIKKSGAKTRYTGWIRRDLILRARDLLK